MATVYKVVDILTDPPSSAITGGIASEFVRFYEIGKITRPVDGTYLYAFSNLGDAQDFMGASSVMKIFVAEAETVEEKPQRSFIISNQSFRGFWEKDTRFAEYVGTVPPGTVWCKWIKPVGELR